MYQYQNIPDMQHRAEKCITKPVERYGVQIHHDVDPDWCGPEFVIDPADMEGLEIYRQFCKRMAEHYKKLDKQ